MTQQPPVTGCTAARIVSSWNFPDFYLPFSGNLDPDNRWVALAQLVPWELAEKIYHADLCQDSGQPIVPARVALGALLIKERQGLTDRETVETIAENPYLQFFIGFEEFTQESPFDASLMVDFRKRFGEDGMQRMAEAIALASLQRIRSPKQKPNRRTTLSHPPNDGQLIADATCAPADIRYPTDVSSAQRSARENRCDHRRIASAPLVGKTPRPRTYRVKGPSTLCRSFTKHKKPGP